MSQEAQLLAQKIKALRASAEGSRQRLRGRCEAFARQRQELWRAEKGEEAKRVVEELMKLAPWLATSFFSGPFFLIFALLLRKYHKVSISCYISICVGACAFLPCMIEDSERQQLLSTAQNHEQQLEKLGVKRRQAQRAVASQRFVCLESSGRLVKATEATPGEVVTADEVVDRELEVETLPLAFASVVGHLREAVAPLPGGAGLPGPAEAPGQGEEGLPASAAAQLGGAPLSGAAGGTTGCRTRSGGGL